MCSFSYFSIWFSSELLLHLHSLMLMFSIWWVKEKFSKRFCINESPALRIQEIYFLILLKEIIRYYSAWSKKFQVIEWTRNYIIFYYKVVTRIFKLVSKRFLSGCIYKSKYFKSRNRRIVRKSNNTLDQNMSTLKKLTLVKRTFYSKI